MIAAMQASGFSIRAIASTLGMPWTTVQRWKTGSCPNFEDGRAMLRLFESKRQCIKVPVRIF
jgi:hypothetical protein